MQTAPLRSLLVIPRSPWTRLFDIAVASLVLLFVSPIILIAAIAVRLTSPGPAFFRQERMGRWGRTFTIYKLRSMYQDADKRKQEVLELNEQTGPVFKCAKDPRITPLGRLLRRTSIDELPQLWNVLKGDMSIVGPRPPLPSEVKEYQPWQLRRLEMQSGLTCIWQVSGRSEIKFEDWVRLDIRYGRMKSLWFDLRLLARTLPAVLTGRGAT
jgi:lipopolysaccharide/colanic/teichoic acid biosynthesis glycosyltransferase